MRAAGAWVDDGFVTGQAGDADVEEAAEGEADEDDEDGNEPDWNIAGQNQNGSLSLRASIRGTRKFTVVK
jgi:hypothetical protein